MEQTFRFNDQTSVQGLEAPRATANQPRTMAVRDLIGKEGSEVTVMWKEEASAKMATWSVWTRLYQGREAGEKDREFGFRMADFGCFVIEIRHPSLYGSARL